MAKRKRRKLKKNSYIILFIIIFICIINYNWTHPKKINNNTNNNIVDNNDEEVKKEKYKECLNEKYSDKDNSDTLKEKEEELISFIKKYNPGLYYLDPNTGYSIKYNEDVNYYAASTIKMLDAIYIYNKALDKELDLDDKVEYKRSNYLGASKKMKNYNYGDKVSLRDLVNYAVTVSDNTAHSMLVDYIGFSNLKEYGKSLGATKTLVGGDIFGEININDAICYLNELYRFINDDNEYSEELKQIFLDSEQNYLDIPEENIDAAIKYGEYEYYYHENGIVFAKEPYLVSILTTLGKNEDAFRSINSKVYELHQTFYKEREDRCHKEIYE